MAGVSEPQVVVVGGGFAGIQAVQGLRRTPAQVVILDRFNHHVFQPLLYQVATAALSPADIASPIRHIFRRYPHVLVVLSQVTAVDVDRRVVRAGHAEVTYDYLVLAAGATHTYFGHDEWAPAAPGLKTIDDALELRRRLLLAFEEAELEADPAARRAKLTFAIVGGGPTGVELAGAIQEIAAHTLRRDFRRIDTSTVQVVLLEADQRLLPAMDPRLSARAKQDLEALGVEVRLGAKVTHVDRDEVRIGPERLPVANVFWAAGVRASPLAESLGCPLDRAGRVLVRPDLSVPGHPEVFVVGDLAAVQDLKSGRPVPGLAPAAMQMGRFVARLIDRQVRTGQRDASAAFHYRDKGTLATVGRARAVAQIGRWRFAGLAAWLLWSLVHILFLISFRNKLFVMLNWFWAYSFWSKGARLITGSPPLRIEHPIALAQRRGLPP